MRFEPLWSNHATRLARLAYALTGKESAAGRISRRALMRTFGRFQTLRDPHEIELYATRTTVKLASRWWLRPGHGSGSAGDEAERDRLWRALAALGRRDRSVLVLRSMRGSSARATADVLQRTVPGTNARFSRALGRLGTISEVRMSAPDLEAELRTLLQARAAAIDQPALGSVETRRAATATRIVTVLAACGLLASASWSLPRLSAIAARSLVDDRAATQAVPQARPPVRRFGLCPDMSRARAPGRGAAADATAVAVRFNHALIRRDASAIARLAYPAITTRDPDYWVPTSSARGIRVTHSASAKDDSLAILDCGQEVARGSWEVVIHDHTPTIGEGLARYYLVRRSDGWKVWGFDPNA